jgi:hypothetical protein
LVGAGQSRWFAILARPAHFRSANAQCFVLLAHHLQERLIGSVGPGLFGRILPLVAILRASVAEIKIQTLRSSKIQSVGGDLTEEKRHAATITRVVEFWQ